MEKSDRLKASGAFVAALSIALFLTAEPTAAQNSPANDPDWYRAQAEEYQAMAQRQFDSGNAAAAVGTLDRILQWQAEYELEIPESFWILRAHVAQAQQLFESVLQSATRYLEIAGSESEHRMAALELVRWAAQAGAARGLQPGKSFSDALSSGGQGPEMVLIPAGRFRMGCVSGIDCLFDETPVREVTIPEAFAVAKYEVTFEQWDACVAGGGCEYRPSDLDWGRANRPVILVSWEDAQAYVSWLSHQTGQSYRLLSEAEWEYVARAGSETAYSWGNEMEPHLANCREPSHFSSFGACIDGWKNTAPVGSFSANAFGVHDMHGNVGEWVEDCRNNRYEQAPSDGSPWLTGDCEFRMVRGGSWDEIRMYLRSSHRYWNAADVRYNHNGFRVARTLSP